MLPILTFRLAGGLGTGKQPIQGQEWDDAALLGQGSGAKSRSGTLHHDLGQGNIGEGHSGGCRVKRKGIKERRSVEPVKEEKRRRKQGS